MLDNEYREMLIKLRSQLVGAMHVQPFTIYTDATIEDLIKAKPKSLADLEKVKGFPPKGKRVAGFGESIIAIFKGNVKATNVSAKNGKISVGVELKKIEAFG